jgi:hypothetical protein
MTSLLLWSKDTLRSKAEGRSRNLAANANRGL